MTQDQLEMIKNDIAYRMIEASDSELIELERELTWVEELIKETKDEKENI